jgi:hypothetical protein
MIEYASASTIRRRIGMLQRAFELTVVLMLVVIGTVLNLAFGWVSLLFSLLPITKGTKVVAFPATVTTSKEL